MNSVLRKQVETSITAFSPPNDHSKKLYRFVASDENPDRAGDIILASAWDTKNWEKNPVILWGHQGRELPIAKGVNVTKDDVLKQLLVDIEFPEEGVHPFADTVRKLVDKGFINSVSIGARPIKSEKIDPEDNSWFGAQKYLEVDLLEVSIVSVPMNPRALQVLNSAEKLDVIKRHLITKDLVAINFCSADWDEDKISTWLKDRGLSKEYTERTVGTKQTTIFNSTSKQTINFIDEDSSLLERIVIEDGVIGIFRESNNDNNTAVMKAFEAALSKVIEASMKSIDAAYAKFSTKLEELFKGSVDSTNALSKSVRELAQLAELVTPDSNGLLVSGQKPVDTSATTISKELEAEIALAVNELGGLIKTIN